MKFREYLNEVKGSRLEAVEEFINEWFDDVRENEDYEPLEYNETKNYVTKAAKKVFKLSRAELKALVDYIYEWVDSPEADGNLPAGDEVALWVSNNIKDLK